MVSDKLLVQHLVHICEKKGIKYVVFSPGSRNAALVISFNEQSFFNCITIPDERVAAFYAMGLAQQIEQPVIIVCTSGSAALNYAPAVAEAYHQNIPLLVITADRPVEWIDQRAGQTMRQQNVYHNYIKKSFQLTQEATHQDDLWYNDRIICEAIDTTMLAAKGPVHINIPFREPLYETVHSSDLSTIKIVETLSAKRVLSEHLMKSILTELEEYGSKLILVGQQFPDEKLDQILSKLINDSSVVILTETTSNVAIDGVHSCIDRFITSVDDDTMEAYIPDLLITIGGAIISKKIKALFRKYKPKAHWHIDEDEHYIDTYQCLTKNIKTDPLSFFHLMNDAQHSPHDFALRWEKHETQNRIKHQQFIQSCDWSDLKVFDLIQKQLPPDSDLHLANSTPVRYNQLFDKRNDLRYFSNRGVSGIDGCSSTAIGAAVGTLRMTTLITGDMAFFYDSNALWNQNLPSNIVIIIMNNGGGGIFKIIPGPKDIKQYETFFATEQSYTGEHIAKTFHCDYLKAENENELLEHLDKAYTVQRNGPLILEVFTNTAENEIILADYFKALL